MKFYVTDHSADDELTFTNIKELYHWTRVEGISSIRYDFRWNRIEPEMNKLNEEQLRRYVRAAALMVQEGLEVPTIILSSIPGWALKMYKKDNKEGFFNAFQSYVQKVRTALNELDCKITHVQVLNEWNNPIYTRIAMRDFPRLCEIVREVFNDYSGIKIMGTIIASNINNFLARFGFGINLFDYLRKLKEIKGSFDVIAVDYYPGLWHFPLSQAGFNWRNIFANLEMLKVVFEEIAGWGIEYELGETGLPTKWPWSEERQLQFYQVFFESFQQLLKDFEKRGITSPSRIGLYEATDEAPKNLLGKFLQVATPFPEHDLGMRKSDGSRKLILQGPGYCNGEPSRLSEIIKSMST